jgi:hypothetical protein
MSSIPAGYQLHVYSWENDYDSRRSEVVSGLTLDEAKYYLEVAKLFKDDSQYHNLTEWDSVNWEDLYDAFQEINSRYAAVFNDFFPGISFNDLDEDGKQDVITDITYTLMGGSEAYTFRTFEKYEAYYVPATINEVALF